MIARILIALDGSESSRRVLAFGMELAKQTGSTVVLLTVVEPDAALPPVIPGAITPTHLPEPADDYLQEMAGAFLEEAGTFCEESGVPCEQVIRSGDPAEEIRREAEKRQADLTVMGFHSKGPLAAALVGNVTKAVLEAIRTPVLIVHDLPPAT